MELTHNERCFVLPDNILNTESVLKDLYSHFGSSQELYHLNEDEIDCVNNTLSQGAVFPPKKLYLFDYLLIQPSAIPSLEKSLKEKFKEFVYIIGEHTSLTPQPDCIDFQHEEMIELKRLFPELHSVVEFVVRYKLYFKIFYKPEKQYELVSSDEVRKARIINSILRSAMHDWSDEEDDWEERDDQHVQKAVEEQEDGMWAEACSDWEDKTIPW
jgi:hypothetical protein